MRYANDIEVCVEVMAETDKAYKVSEDGDPRRAVWVPKSQLIATDPKDPGKGDTAVLTMPEWLAKDKELI